MNNLNKANIFSSKHPFQDLCQSIDVVDNHYIQFSVFLSLCPVTNGDPKDVYELSYCMSEEKQWIQFDFRPSLYDVSTASFVEDISLTGNSINIAIEKILPKVISRSELVYDFVFEETNGQKKRLYNRLKKTQKVDKCLRDFINMAHRLNEIFHEFKEA